MAELETCKFAEIKEDDDISTYSSALNGIENCAYGIGKTHSLPANATMNIWNDGIIHSALQVSPEDLASQLTLLDFPTFAAICPEELTTCAWNKKNKAIVSPNVVAFTRRFNQVSFWTVQEVLNGATAKRRAEIIIHFIKVAKKLYEFNNIHSLFAVISALQSASIYRLTQTWTCLSKKEKHTFDRLAQLFNDENNWSTLREYLQSLKLPCIPYLGIFLTDLVYIDMAHGVGTSYRSIKMNTILACLSFYQKSDYNHLKSLPVVQQYLKSVRYIEELQKFHEDDQYKLSLKLEPPSPCNSACGSKESVKVRETSNTSCGISPSHRNASGPLGLSATSIQTKFLPGHRKSQSLGTKFRSTSLPRNFHKVSGIAGIFNKNYMFESVADCNRTIISGVNLLDDTVLELPAVTPQVCTTVLNNLSDATGTLSSDWSEAFQGPIKRKTVLKEGRKPPVSSWQRYWVQLWANSLIYFSPKSFIGVFSSTRTDFKLEPCKVQRLDDWTTNVHHKDNSDTFLLTNSKTGCIYKFRTESHESALHWVSLLEAAITKSQKPLPANLMSFE